MGMSILVSLFRTVLIMQIGDKLAKGAVTVMFDMRPDDWLEGYQTFIKWIKCRVNNKFIIG
jgi:hypothetical protein